MFRRGTAARFIFDSMQMVRNNWRHYCDLYGVSRGSYRNDFALSRALGLVSGHGPVWDSFPTAMMNVLPDQILRQQSQDQYQIIWKDPEGRDRCIQLKGIDFFEMHALVVQ